MRQSSKPSGKAPLRLLTKRRRGRYADSAVKVFYRSAFLFVICFAAFLAGWLMRGFYFEPAAVEGQKPPFEGAGGAFSPKSEEAEQAVSPPLPLAPPAAPKSDRAEKPPGPRPLPAGQDSGRKPKEGFEKQREKYDKMNREQLGMIPKDQKLFAPKGPYSFLINAFDNEAKALKYIQGLKKRFPLWSFLIKARPRSLKIYLGPFETEKSATEFIQSIPEPAPFPGYFLEKTPL